MKALKHQRGRFVASLTALALVAAVAIGAFSSPSTAEASHSWGGYHWARTANPFTIKLGNNVTSGWSSSLSTASADWTASSVLNTTIVAGSTTRSRCAPSAGRVQVCNYTYGSNGWLGLAQIWLASGTSHITQGTVKLNDTYFNQAKYNNSAEKLHVMCQEIGHTFGLDHQSTSGASLNTCMDYYQNTSASDTKSTHPNQHDYDQLASIYAHLDSTTTVGFITPANGNAANSELSDAADWGNVVERSADGRTATYLRHLTNGERVLTFVTWAR